MEMFQRGEEWREGGSVCFTASLSISDVTPHLLHHTHTHTLALCTDQQTRLNYHKKKPQRNGQDKQQFKAVKYNQRNENKTYRFSLKKKESERKKRKTAVTEQKSRMECDEDTARVFPLKKNKKLKKQSTPKDAVQKKTCHTCWLTEKTVHTEREEDENTENICFVFGGRGIVWTPDHHLESCASRPTFRYKKTAKTSLSEKIPQMYTLFETCVSQMLYSIKYLRCVPLKSVITTQSML